MIFPGPSVTEGGTYDLMSVIKMQITRLQLSHVQLKSNDSTWSVSWLLFKSMRAGIVFLALLAKELDLGPSLQVESRIWTEW